MEEYTVSILRVGVNKASEVVGYVGMRERK
jgi:hypothetical protein